MCASQKKAEGGQPDPVAAPAPAAPAATPAAPAAKKEYTECVVQIRTADGKTLQQTFKPTDTLRAVYTFAQQSGVKGNFALLSTFPRKVYHGAALDSTTLQQAGTPSDLCTTVEMLTLLLPQSSCRAATSTWPPHGNGHREAPDCVVCVCEGRSQAQAPLFRMLVVFLYIGDPHVLCGRACGGCCCIWALARLSILAVLAASDSDRDRLSDGAPASPTRARFAGEPCGCGATGTRENVLRVAPAAAAA